MTFLKQTNLLSCFYLRLATFLLIVMSVWGSGSLNHTRQSYRLEDNKVTITSTSFQPELAPNPSLKRAQTLDTQASPSAGDVHRQRSSTWQQYNWTVKTPWLHWKLCNRISSNSSKSNHVTEHLRPCRRVNLLPLIFGFIQLNGTSDSSLFTYINLIFLSRVNVDSAAFWVHLKNKLCSILNSAIKLKSKSI